MKRVFGLKELLLALTAGLFTTVVFTAVLEVVLRLGLIHNPEYVRLRIQGKRQDAHWKLLILGDSFINPQGLTARLLARDLGAHDFAVLNLAVSGTGPFEYLAELENEGVAFEPDVVLLSYYVGNDLTDVQHNPRFPPGSDHGEARGIAINTASSRPFLRELYLYHYIVPRIQLFRARRFDFGKMVATGIAPDLIEDARQLKISPYLLTLALHHKNHLLDNILINTEQNMKAWDKVKELLSEIHDVCRRIDAELLLVIFPHSIQIDEFHFEFFRKLTFNIDERTLSSVMPQTLMTKFCDARGIPCLDLLPAFKARENEQLYLEKDSHLNEEGHRFAARLIRDFVVMHAPAGR